MLRQTVCPMAAKAKEVQRWIACVDPKTGDTYSLKVDAFVLPGIKHLFVNRYMERVPGKKKLKETKFWTITHRKSGLRFPWKVKFTNKSHALKVMAKIADVTDWENDIELLPLSKEFKERIYDIIEEVTGARPSS